MRNGLLGSLAALAASAGLAFGQAPRLSPGGPAGSATAGGPAMTAVMPGQYGPPTMIAVDNEGRVYVCESFDRIHVYAADGRFIRTLKAPHSVEALAFDSQNNLYVAGGNKVSKLVLDR